MADFVASEVVKSPEKRSGASTKVFLTHCFGRIRRKIGCIDIIGVGSCSMNRRGGWYHSVLLKLNGISCQNPLSAVIATLVNLFGQKVTTTLIDSQYADLSRDYTKNKKCRES